MDSGLSDREGAWSGGGAWSGAIFNVAWSGAIFNV
jgi:hypothetical protein